MVANEIVDVEQRSGVGKVNAAESDTGLHQQWIKHQIAQVTGTNGASTVTTADIADGLKAADDSFKANPDKTAAMDQLAPTFNDLVTKSDENYKTVFEQWKTVGPTFWHKQCDADSTYKKVQADIEKLPKSQKHAADDAFLQFTSGRADKRQAGENYLKQIPDLYKDAQAARTADTAVHDAEDTVGPVIDSMMAANLQRVNVRGVYSVDLAQSGQKYDQQANEVKEKANAIFKGILDPEPLSCDTLESNGWQPDWSKTDIP